MADRRNFRPPFSPLLEAAESAYRAALPADWDGFARAALAAADGSIVTARRPGESASLAATIAGLREFFGDDWAPGDVALTNDVFRGCSHPTEFTALAPLFGADASKNPLAWLAVRADLPDVGGWALGGYTRRALDIWGEGVRIVPIKLVRAGRLRAEVVEILCLNSRTPRLSRACAHGWAAAAEAAAKTWSGLGIADAAAFARAEDGTRQKADAALAVILGRLPRGQVRASGRAPLAQPGDAALEFEVELDCDGARVRVGVSQASAPGEHALHATRAMVADAVATAVAGHLGLDDDETIALAPRLELEIPDGSPLAATRALPVGHARLLTCPAIGAAVRSALSRLGVAPAAPETPAEEAPILDPATGALAGERQRYLLRVEAQTGGQR